MKNHLFVGAALAAIMTVFYTWYYMQAMGNLTLSIRVRAATNLERPVLQLFVDTGDGFRQEDSRRFPLAAGQASQNLEHTIRSSTVHRLRLDYLDGPGSVHLEDMHVRSARGEVILVIPVPDNSVLNQTSISRQPDGTVTLTSPPGASDPFVVIPFPEPFVSPAGRLSPAHVRFGVAVFCTLFAGLSLIFILTGNRFGRQQ